MSELQKDWKNLELEVLPIREIDVLNGMKYEECSQLQQMLFHIVKDYQVKISHLELEVDKLKIDVLHLVSEIEKIK